MRICIAVALVLFGAPALADGGEVDVVALGTAARMMVADGLARPVGSNDAVVMGLVARLGEVVIEGEPLDSVEMLGMRSVPRSDGAMSTRSVWVFDCAGNAQGGRLAIRELTSFADGRGQGAVVATQSWSDVEVAVGLRVPGADTLGAKMLQGICGGV